MGFLVHSPTSDLRGLKTTGGSDLSGYSMKPSATRLFELGPVWLSTSALSAMMQSML